MITIAENAGFCFGVRRATDTLEELIKKTKTKSFEDAFVSIATGGKL